MKAEDLRKLEQRLPEIIEASSKFFSGTLRKLSDIHQHKSQKPPLSQSSSFKTNSTMNPCWSTCESDHQSHKPIQQNTIEPCEFCLAPSSSIIKSDVFNITRERQSSEPVPVPDGSSTEQVENEQPPPYQSNSSGYESAFGNGLSSTKGSWTLGIGDYPSNPTSTCDNLSNDQDPSVLEDQSSTTDGPDEQDDTDEVDDDSFEVLSFEGPPESSLYIKEFQYTTSHSQNNVCDCCNMPFKAIPDVSPRRCCYYGKLYCSRCHNNEFAYIPAKVVNRFDMHPYPVCRRAKSVLQSNFRQPMFDIQNDNENLYLIQSQLAEAKALRMQFQIYYAYLSTCTRIENELNEKYLKEFYAREYLYQSVHLYSMHDLLSLKKILQMLQTVIARAREHVYSCEICCEKGFTCEICKNRKHVLYPFYDAKVIGRCEHCSNIYHRRCWDRIDRDCPKCYRIRQRREDQGDQ